MNRIDRNEQPQWQCAISTICLSCQSCSSCPFEETPPGSFSSSLYNRPRRARADDQGGDVNPRAWFRCINGCPGEIPLTDVIYECPTCGSLPEVAHSLDVLRRRSAASWTRLF